MRRGWVANNQNFNKRPQPFAFSCTESLTFAYSEHFGSARRTYALGGRLTVLHPYAFGVLHFFLSAALHAIGLHNLTSFFV